MILFAARGETMATRDDTRQELRDLAKLAATMPKERPTPLPRPDVQLQRPLTPSAISALTVPPAVASIPPASITLPPFQTKKRGGRAGVLAVSVVLGLSVAVAGGVTLGRTLARRAPPTAAAASDVKVVTFGAPAAAPAPLPAPAPSPAPSPAPALSPPPVVAAATPLATPAAATAAPLPKAAAATPAWRRAGAKPAPKSSLAANIPSSTGVKDPLEEAIRKAVASAPPSPPPTP
jgi:hypothetical protein